MGRCRQGAPGVRGLADPTADGLIRDVLRRIGREGHDRGRGQIAGIGWAYAEAAASLSSNGSVSLQGLRDAAIIRVMPASVAPLLRGRASISSAA